MFGGLGGDTGAQSFQIFAGGGNVLADLRADFDLALQEFRADLIGEFGLAGLHKAFWRFGQIMAVAIDEKVFLLDPHRKRFLHLACLPDRSDQPSAGLRHR